MFARLRALWNSRRAKVVCPICGDVLGYKAGGLFGFILDDIILLIHGNECLNQRSIRE